MPNPICLLAWMAALITLPLILLFEATESRPFKIRRWRKQGATWKAIAERLGCSATTARRWALGRMRQIVKDREE